MAEFEEFGWDSEIEEDGNGGEYIILPEGDYWFTVTNIDKGRYEGSAKIPACQRATLTLEVEGPDGKAICYKNLYISKSVERMLSDFFRCIGMKKKGERVRMDWSKVMGSRGRAHFKARSYNGNEYNEVKYFIDSDDKFEEMPSEDTPW